MYIEAERIAAHNGQHLRWMPDADDREMIVAAVLRERPGLSAEAAELVAVPSMDRRGRDRDHWMLRAMTDWSARFEIRVTAAYPVHGRIGHDGTLIGNPRMVNTVALMFHGEQIDAVAVDPVEERVVDDRGDVRYLDRPDTAGISAAVEAMKARWGYVIPVVAPKGMKV